MEYIDFILKIDNEKYHLKLNKEYFLKIIENFDFIEKNEIYFFIFFNYIIKEISNEKNNFNKEDNQGVCYINWDNNQFFISSSDDFLPYNIFYIPSLFFNINQTAHDSLIQRFFNLLKRGFISNKIDCYYSYKNNFGFNDFELNFNFKNKDDLINLIKNYRKIEQNPIEEFENFNLSIVDNQVNIKDIKDFSMLKFNVDLKKWNFKNLKYNDNSIKEILKISNIDDF